MIPLSSLICSVPSGGISLISDLTSAYKHLFMYSGNGTVKRPMFELGGDVKPCFISKFEMYMYPFKANHLPYTRTIPLANQISR